MTMRELAKIANVSISTVSKAFLDADDVSDETKKLIFDIAKEQGCFGKYYKGKYHKRIFAIICPELRGSYYSRYVEKLQKNIESNNSIAIISTDHFGFNSQAELVDYFASYLKVDGIYIIEPRTQLKKGYEVPIVNIFGHSVTAYDSVTVDYIPALENAITRLVEYGHEEIVFFGESLTKSKQKRFFDTVSRFKNVKSHSIISSLRFESAGVYCARKLLEMENPPKAIVCAYDDIALGAIGYLKNHGYSIPDDFSIIGMDNINASEFLDTPLTTIGSAIDEVVFTAIDLMNRKLNNRYYKLPHSVTITAKLIERRTIGKYK